MSLLQILRFFLSSPLLYTMQSGLLRSAASSHDTSDTGGTRELVSVGKGNRTPLPFPLPRRPSAQRRLLFQHGSLDQALLESFSESRGKRGIDRIGALRLCSPRESEPRGKPEGRPRARLGARRPPIRQWRPPAAWLGSRRCTWLDPSLMQSRNGWVCVPGKGKLRIRTREADASTMARGCRAGACGHRPGRAGFRALPPTAASPGSCAPRGFLAGEPGVRGAGSEPRSSQPRQALSGAVSGLYCSGSPRQPFGVGPG